MKRPRRRELLRHLQFDLIGRSLSARVLWLTVGIIMLVEVVILVPSLGRERQNWLLEHARLAELAAMASMEARADGNAMAAQNALLKLSGAQAVTLTLPDGRTVRLPPAGGRTPDGRVSLGSETLLQSSWRAQLAVLGLSGTRLEVLTPSPKQFGVTLDIVLDGTALAAHLRRYAVHLTMLSVIVALMTGLMVFAALDRMLVRPMQIITASITGFRQNPEQAARHDLAWLARRPDDEIAHAARELKLMQDELHAALWRNARLAALGISVAKISHDLRNILSSALLVTDRLPQNTDPAAERAARTLISAVERAAQLVCRTVDFAREGPPALVRSAVALRELVDEAAQGLQGEAPAPDVVNLVPNALVLALDRMQIYRVLANLMRNAAEAGAGRITLCARETAAVTRIELRDDGPGLPAQAQARLFKPFTGVGRSGGTGLGLAIARDLVRAHGGELSLAETGPCGTAFVIELPADGAADETRG